MPDAAIAELLDDTADRLAAGARALSSAGAGMTAAVPGWLGGAAHAEATSAVVLRGWLDSSCDAFGLVAGALRQYAEAVRDGSANTATGRTAAIVRTAATMAPARPMVPGQAQRPEFETISWGSALDDVLGAGKAVGRGVESLGGDAVSAGISAGKDLAHLGESAAGGFESFLGFVDDTNLTLNADAHAMLSTLGDTAAEIWGGLERAAGARPGELMSLESLSHWRSWFGQVGFALGDPALRGVLQEAGEIGATAAGVAKVIFSDYGRYREIEKQQQYPPIEGAPRYDEIHRTAESDKHIIVGMRNGNGGHMARVGRPGKTEFPDGWNEEKILEVVDKAAQNPIGDMQKRTIRTGKIRFGYRGEADGLEIVIATDANGEIISAYPVKGQHGIYKNPTAPEKPSEFTTWGPKWVRPDHDPHGTGYFIWHRQDGSDAYTDINGNQIQR